MNRFQITPGISDEEFIRGEVPMTKEEVREISLCKLHLTASSVLYDVGSGTGSISVEAARLSKDIQVYSIEVNPEAVELTKQNGEKFCCQNLQVISGAAPQAFEKLPSPTHAFIGGSKGNLKEILSALYKKNPEMRVVLNAVSMESICEINSLLKNLPVENAETVQISVSKTRKLGDYNLLMANNPVFVFSFDFKAEK